MDIIFDIDGTLSDPSHRLDFIRTHPKNWPAFHAATLLDEVHWDIVDLLKMYKAAGHRIIICTARDDSNYDLTKQWLDENATIAGLYEKIYMRTYGDYRSDSIVKPELLDKMRSDGYDPKIAVEDRTGVVKMWRENGLRCLQVCDGDY